MPLNIAITGATGMIGSVLIDHCRKQGYHVTPILRRDSKGLSLGIKWDIEAGTIEADKLEGQDIIIHLAGASVSERWSSGYRKLIESSRVDGTRLLSRTLAGLKQKPRLLVTASAIGYYGNHPADTMVDESSPSGAGFLPDVCRRWEDETRIAVNAGIRVVHLRFGIVLGKEGGALAKMLPIFNLGLGGVLGRGDQMMSWVALAEIPSIVAHIIQTESLSGPINVVAPGAVSNREFTRVLGQALKRPVFLPVPAFGIKLLFGEMGQKLLLEGAHVAPRRLLASKYVFQYSDLPALLQKMLVS